VFSIMSLAIDCKPVSAVWYSIFFVNFFFLFQPGNKKSKASMNKSFIFF
jgi:hypothetical protein